MGLQPPTRLLDRGYFRGLQVWFKVWSAKPVATDWSARISDWSNFFLTNVYIPQKLIASERFPWEKKLMQCKDLFYRDLNCWGIHNLNTPRSESLPILQHTWTLSPKSPQKWWKKSSDHVLLVVSSTQSLWHQVAISGSPRGPRVHAPCLSGVCAPCLGALQVGRVRWGVASRHKGKTDDNLGGGFNFFKM